MQQYELFEHPSLPGFRIAVDDVLGDAGVFVMWPRIRDGWRLREPFTKNRKALVEVSLELAQGSGWPGAPRGGEMSERVTLRLSPDEREQWTELAGERPLGEWIRERCNAAAAAIAYAARATSANGCRIRLSPAASPRGQSEAFQPTQGDDRQHHPPQTQLELAAI